MFDVAIIGCGPVGALAANLLGKAGLSVAVLEKEAALHPLPRAVHLDHEMMRLFQSAGVIDRIEPDMLATDGHLHVGSDHGVIRYMGTVGKPRPFGWANDYFFYQPELEAHLRAGFVDMDNVELNLGAVFTGLVQTADGVSVSYDADGASGEVTARWVIACDGSRSPVRNALGVALDDLDFEEPWLVVDAEVKGPVSFPPIEGVPADADLQRLSVMMCDPSRPATIVPGRRNHRRWEFMLLPGEGDAEMMAPDKVSELVGAWMKNVPHEIVRASTYRFHGLVAEHWQVGNVFLTGDAAHQTPPFFGQGMCHGLRDVANLAWKMAAIVKRRRGTHAARYLSARAQHACAWRDRRSGGGRALYLRTRPGQGRRARRRDPSSSEQSAGRNRRRSDSGDFDGRHPARFGSGGRAVHPAGAGRWAQA
jgi:3-(3-hydroxy-phenyl)propionate hydroxylase